MHQKAAMAYLDYFDPPELPAGATTLRYQLELGMVFHARQISPSPSTARLLTTYMITTDKATREYVAGCRRVQDHMIADGGIQAFVEGVGHFENCINSAKRALRALGRLGTQQDGPEIDRTIRKLAQSKAKTITDLRDAIEHMDAVITSEAGVEDRAIPGHWEGDLIAGSKNSHIVTLVERHSRFVMLAKIKDRKSESVVSALIKQAKKLPNELYKSLTLDRGTEFADHRRFKVETNIDVYFCDPNSPWQRGSNENTNRLLRQYFPKGTDLSVHSQAKLSAVARQLNERPRKTLNYETPAERFKTCVASTG